MLRRHGGGERDGVTEQQGCRIDVDLFSQSDSLFQYLLGGGLIGARQNSRDVHQSRGADRGFRTLRLLARRQEKLL
jgi:hypothetical protein